MPAKAMGRVLLFGGSRGVSRESTPDVFIMIHESHHSTNLYYSQARIHHQIVRLGVKLKVGYCHNRLAIVVQCGIIG